MDPNHPEIDGRNFLKIHKAVPHLTPNLIVLNGGGDEVVEPQHISCAVFDGHERANGAFTVSVRETAAAEVLDAPVLTTKALPDVQVREGLNAYGFDV